MRTIILFFSAIFILPFTGYSQAVIEISNSSGMAREAEVVAIPWKDVLWAFPSIDTADFQIISTKEKKQLPYQLEYVGSSHVQNLLVQVAVNAKSSLRLRLQKGKPAAFAAKTYCRYVPERKDDFAWENDKITFRMYGKALEGTKEDANGMDVWVKRTDKLIINERYKRGEYHIDHGDGMDYYHVGFSLGAGNIAPYVNDTIRYPKNYHRWKVLDNGPLRSTFQLEYDEWDVVGQQVRVTKTISLDAGAQLNRVEATYFFDKIPTLPVVVGIIKRKETGAEWFDETKGIMGYWEPTDAKNGTTGVGSLFTQPVQQMMMGKAQLLTLMQAKPGQPVLYYTGAAWDRAGAITSSDKWFNYLKACKQKLEQPLKIIVRKAS